MKHEAIMPKKALPAADTVRGAPAGTPRR